MISDRFGSEVGFSFFRYLGDSRDTGLEVISTSLDGRFRTVRGVIRENRFVAFKAFAINKKTNHWGWSYHHASPDQAVRTALASCIEKTQAGTPENGVSDSACTIIALGNQIIEELPREELALLKRQYFEQGLRASMPTFNEYKSRAAHKAIAVDLSAAIVAPVWERSDPELAAKEALMHCREKGANCELFAVGDEIILPMSTPMNGLFVHLTMKENGGR